MKTILHISADFPDPLAPGKTKAAANLLKETTRFRHVVYSLNRVSWKSGVRSLPFGDGNVAVAYGAPPYGLGLSRYLAAVTDDIADHVPSARGKPDLIHAHKFSVEGLVAADLSRRLGVPFISSFWGDTDCKIVSAKRRLRGRYREVAAAAKLLLPAAPWTARFMTSTLDVPKDRMEILPIMTAASSIIAPQLSASGNLVSMFSLDSWKRKGLDVLVGAMKAIAAARPNVILDVYGGGSPRSFFDATTLIAEAGMTKTVVLRGPLPHDKVQETMNRYAAFVMAPRRETFGMVHVEALLAGLPVLWAKDRGIDGLIDESVGVRCDPNSIADVTAGIDYVLGNERDLKRKVARLQADGAFDHLRREGIARTYSEILSRMTSQGETASRRLLVAVG
jgi:glycosyltransferase involved in cell wall biosynthesis